VSKAEITARLKQLEKQWSIERALEATAATFTVIGVGLAAIDGKTWLLLAGAGAMLSAANAANVWCPLAPVFRYLGLRSATEIQMERYALKLVRGDFESIVEALQDQSADAESVMDAVRN
jgi:hypothetical protein